MGILDFIRSQFMWGLHPAGTPRCWMCGARADSSEHIFKRSDLTRAYGHGAFEPTNAPAHVKQGKITLLKSSRARVVKYAPSLCRPCNGAKSQPFDRAYSTFVDWVIANEEDVLRRRQIDLANVFGEGVEDGARDLYKYFAKSLGCRLIDAATRVPPDIVWLFGRKRWFTGLRLTLGVDEAVNQALGADRWTFLAKSDLIVWRQRSNPKILQGYTWTERIGCLVVNHWYGVPPDGSTGSCWVADSRILYLGTPPTVVDIDSGG